MRSRFFSVSPMYFETTVARSIRKSSRPRSRASTWAAIVLPVPDSPAKSVFSPCVAARRCARSPTRRAPGRGGGGSAEIERRTSSGCSGSTSWSQPNAGSSRAASSPSRPLDALARAQVEVARRRGRLALDRGGVARHLGGVGDLAHRQAELRGDVVHVVRRRRAAAQAARRSANVGSGDLDDDRGPVAERDRRVVAERRRRAPARPSPPARAGPRRAPGSSASSPSKQRRRPSRAATRRALAHQPGVAGVGRVHQQERGAEGGGQQAGASGPTTSSGRWVSQARSARRPRSRGAARARWRAPARGAGARRGASRPGRRPAAAPPPGRRPSPPGRRSGSGRARR